MMKTARSNKVFEILGQLAIPLIAMSILLIYNLIRDPGFFKIRILENINGNKVLAGNLISIIDSASELAIITMGMTLVTSACGGQDISVGSVGAISGAVFVKALLQWFDVINVPSIIGALLIACVVTVLFKLFNGTLVSVFKIQPMIATLILFSCGRSIAYWINGSANPQIESSVISAIGLVIPGIPIPTPVFAVAIVGGLFALIFKLTNIKLYTQSVGINQNAARLNGINPILIKMLSCGICRMGNLNHKTLLIDIEMDAILAVAIGGNALGGGRFRMSGSILGAYVIQTLTTTLNAVIKDKPESIKAYKAAVIIIIVVAGSPVIKNWLRKLRIYTARWILKMIMRPEKEA